MVHTNCLYRFFLVTIAYPPNLGQYKYSLVSDGPSFCHYKYSLVSDGCATRQEVMQAQENTTCQSQCVLAKGSLPPAGVLV